MNLNEDKLIEQNVCPSNCPFCDDEDTIQIKVEGDYPHEMIRYGCTGCGREWEEYYRNSEFYWWTEIDNSRW